MKHNVLFTLLSVLLSSLMFDAVAQLPSIQTDRPSWARAPFTVPKGRFQFETGFVFEKAGGFSNVYLPSTAIRIGIMKRAELRLVTDLYYSFDKSSGSINLKPLQVGTKIKFLDGNEGLIPAVSILAHVAIPQASTKNQRVKHPAPNVTLTAQHVIWKSLAFNYNLGMEWYGNSPVPTYTYSFSPGYAIKSNFSAFAEVYGFAGNLGFPIHVAQGGLVYQPKPNWQLDIHGGAGLTPASPDFFVGIGISGRLKN